MKLLVVSLVLLLSTQQAGAYDLGDCFNALEYDNELQLISDKVPLARLNEVTFGMLSNEDTPTPEETQTIYKWAIKREQCFKNYPPPRNLVTNIVREGFIALQAHILDLYKSRITYGQFANLCQETSQMIVANMNSAATQQQQSDQQRQRQKRQFCESRYQQCLDRAKDIYARNACQAENSGCSIGNMFSR